MFHNNRCERKRNPARSNRIVDTLGIEDRYIQAQSISDRQVGGIFHIRPYYHTNNNHVLDGNTFSSAAHRYNENPRPKGNCHRVRGNRNIRTPWLRKTTKERKRILKQLGDRLNSISDQFLHEKHEESESMQYEYLHTLYQNFRSLRVFLFSPSLVAVIVYSMLFSVFMTWFERTVTSLFP